MNGEEFLRGLAAEIVAQADVRHWWERFSSAFGALDLVGAVDEVAARRVGEEIRAGLAARTGVEVSGFYLGSRRSGRQPPRFRPAAPLRDHTGLTARSAWAGLPPAMGAGGVNFVSQTDQECWIVCSGAGPAPWPQPEPVRLPPGAPAGFGAVRSGHAPLPSAEAAMFGAIVDDRGGRYRLEFVSSGAASSGEKRQRWDLRTRLRPAPAAGVGWLRFETPHGPVTAPLRPPVGVRLSTGAIAGSRDAVAYYLTGELYNHVWLHLLDPERPLARLSVVGAALVAVGAVDGGHPLVRAVATVDDAIAGGEATALPPVLAAALAPGPRPPAYVGCTAVGAVVSHPDGAEVGLEALVGHTDRVALHFIEADGSRIGAWGLVVTATDDRGRGHVSHAESLSSMEEGAFHFRPPLARDATHLTVRLEGPSAAVEVRIAVDRPGG